MFLALVEQCEHHYDIAPIDRGHHGLQFRFDYRSPNEDEHYGSISLTFYPSTARLHVQGSSYLLWVDEHLPSIYANTETRFSSQISKWAYLSRQRGIGRKRESRPQRSSVDLALTTSAAPSESPGSTPTAAVCMPAVTTSLSTAITAVTQNTMVSITSPGGTPGGTPDDIQSPGVSNSRAATHLPSVAASPPDATTSTDSDAATATIHQPAENATQSTGCTRATRQASKSATPAVDSVKPTKAKKKAGRLNQRRLRRILQTTIPRPTPTASHVRLVVMSLPLMPRTWSAALYVWSGSIMSVWERIGGMWVCGPVSPVVVSLQLSWTFKHRLTPLHHR